MHALKKNKETLKMIGKGMELEINMLSEISQIQKSNIASVLLSHRNSKGTV